jgi:site-specific DNA-cytosine methylase
MRSRAMQADIDDAEMIRLYEAGMSQEEVAAELGVKTKVIYGHMKRMGYKCRRAIKRNQRGSRNSAWKGDDASYQAMHLRVQATRGAPSACEHCGATEGFFDWASLTKNYADVNDYIRLCRKCHMKMDCVGPRVGEQLRGRTHSDRETEVPRFLLENVPGLMTLNGGRSFGAVLSALTALGYFVRWDHCTAAEVGRPHLRDRVWIVGTREPHGRGWCSVPIGQVKKWPRAGWAYEGYTGEDVPRWPKREVWPLVAAGVCPPPGMWPTPNAGGYNESESVEDWSARRARVKEEAGNGNGFGMPLGVASRLWPTPAVSDNNGAGAHGEGAMDLRTTARLWPSPTACMAKGSSDAARTRADGQDRTFDRLDHAVGDTAQGRLNPAWVESLLMGWPLGWTLPDGPSLADAPAPPRDVEIATRLTMDKAHRRDRLRLTGNGVVTETAALVYRTLLG